MTQPPEKVLKAIKARGFKSKDWRICLDEEGDHFMIGFLYKVEGDKKVECVCTAAQITGLWVVEISTPIDQFSVAA